MAPVLSQANAAAIAVLETRGISVSSSISQFFHPTSDSAKTSVYIFLTIFTVTVILLCTARIVNEFRYSYEPVEDKAAVAREIAFRERERERVYGGSTETTPLLLCSGAGVGCVVGGGVMGGVGGMGGGCVVGSPLMFIMEEEEGEDEGEWEEEEEKDGDGEDCDHSEDGKGEGDGDSRTDSKINLKAN